MRKVRIIGVLFASVGFLISLAMYAYFNLIRWSEQSLPLSDPQVIEFPAGTTLKALSETLVESGVINQAALFKLWVRYFADYSGFQAGMYRFEGNISPRDIAAAMIKGKVYVPLVLEYTIPEGFTVSQTIDRLIAKGVAEKKEFEDLVRNREFLKSLNIEASSLEGYLYPATYRFSKMPSAEEALGKAVVTFWRKIPQDYEEQVKERGLSLEQALTFASLIELETPNDDERNNVSEVIWRRLKARIPLAIDAAIIYGITDYKGNISRRHLVDKSNPYNTRVHGGLPPTPIGSPSLSSIRAVLSPSNEGYYYYVLDPSQGNRHHFSKTLKEHNRYVRKLVQFNRRARQKPGT